jgi:hypothetical protein
LFLRGLLSSFILLVIPLLVLSGCEKNRDKVLSGDYFYRNAGKLKMTSARLDSINNYGGYFKNVTISLAGEYRGMSAFSLVKFGRPQSQIINTLDKGFLKFTVSNVWTEGLNEFELYAANSDWTDTTRIDPGLFLNTLGSPIAVLSDTSNTFSTLVFPLGEEGLNYIKSWQTEGSFLLKNSSGGMAMIGAYTNLGLSSPELELFSHAITESDTTHINAIAGNYYFDTGFGGDMNNKRKGVLSEGSFGGFTIHFTLPDSFAHTNAVNQCKLILPLENNFIPQQNILSINISILSAPFVSADTTSILTTSTTNYTIKPGDTEIELDFSPILNTMYKSLNYNYGILFKPANTYITPSEVIVSIPDSIGIVYTTLPEVQ